MLHALHTEGVQKGVEVAGKEVPCTELAVNCVQTQTKVATLEKRAETCSPGARSM